MIFNTIQDIVNAYTNGLDATIHDENKVDALLGELPMPFLGAQEDIKGTGKGKLAIPYVFAQKYNPNFGIEFQKTSDCTTFGTMHGCVISLCCDIEQRHEAEGYPGEIATEPIYGYRGHGGNGMAVSDAAKFVSKVGGLIVRKKYSSCDLSSYDPNLGIRWGRSGVPQEILSLGKQHQISTVSMISSLDEVLDTLYNGYGIAVGSNYGFESTRDKNGISRKRGSWSHCMSIIGADDTKQRLNETLFLICNSWGAWNSGTRWHNQPLGSFWTDSQTMYGMIKQRQTWAFSNVNGFPARKIDWSIIDEVL